MYTGENNLHVVTHLVSECLQTVVSNPAVALEHDNEPHILHLPKEQEPLQQIWLREVLDLMIHIFVLKWTSQDLTSLANSARIMTSAKL